MTKTCGVAKDDGTPCRQPAGWGTQDDEGPCKHHTSGGDRSGRTRARESDRPWGELQIRRILDALEDGATYAVAARGAGISPRTFRRWRARYPGLQERVHRAEAESASGALGVVAEAAEKGDWRAASWLLERRHGYHGKDKVDAEDVRRFVETVKTTIRDRLDEDKAAQLIVAIGDALEEAKHG